MGSSDLRYCINGPSAGFSIYLLPLCLLDIVLFIKVKQINSFLLGQYIPNVDMSDILIISAPSGQTAISVNMSHN